MTMQSHQEGIFAEVCQCAARQHHNSKVCSLYRWSAGHGLSGCQQAKTSTHQAAQAHLCEHQHALRHVYDVVEAFIQHLGPSGCPMDMLQAHWDHLTVTAAVLAQMGQRLHVTGRCSFCSAALGKPTAKAARAHLTAAHLDVLHTVAHWVTHHSHTAPRHSIAPPMFCCPHSPAGRAAAIRLPAASSRLAALTPLSRCTAGPMHWHILPYHIILHHLDSLLPFALTNLQPIDLSISHTSPTSCLPVPQPLPAHHPLPPSTMSSPTQGVKKDPLHTQSATTPAPNSWHWSSIPSALSHVRNPSPVSHVPASDQQPSTSNRSQLQSQPSLGLESSLWPQELWEGTEHLPGTAEVDSWLRQEEMNMSHRTSHPAVTPSTRVMDRQHSMALAGAMSLTCSVSASLIGQEWLPTSQEVDEWLAQELPSPLPAALPCEPGLSTPQQAHSTHGTAQQAHSTPSMPSTTQVPVTDSHSTLLPKIHAATDRDLRVPDASSPATQPSQHAKPHGGLPALPASDGVPLGSSLPSSTVADTAGDILGACGLQPLAPASQFGPVSVDLATAGDRASRRHAVQALPRSACLPLATEAPSTAALAHYCVGRARSGPGRVSGSGASENRGHGHCSHTASIASGAEEVNEVAMTALAVSQELDGHWRAAQALIQHRQHLRTHPTPRCSTGALGLEPTDPAGTVHSTDSSTSQHADTVGDLQCSQANDPPVAAPAQGAKAMNAAVGSGDHSSHLAVPTLAAVMPDASATLQLVKAPDPTGAGCIPADNAKDQGYGGPRTCDSEALGAAAAAGCSPAPPHRTLDIQTDTLDTAAARTLDAADTAQMEEEEWLIATDAAACASLLLDHHSLNPGAAGNSSAATSGVRGQELGTTQCPAVSRKLSLSCIGGQESKAGAPLPPDTDQPITPPASEQNHRSKALHVT